MMLYTRWLAKKFWALLAILTILCAVLVQVGRMVSPMVAENKEAISDYLGEQLGVEITADQLSLHWSGLRPELRLGGLHFMGPDGKPVISVKRADAQIDLLASLLVGRVQMWQVELDGVDLTLAQGRDNRWSISGFTDRPKNPESDSPRNPIDALLIGRYVHLQAVNLNFQLRNGVNQRLRLSNMLLQNQQGFHRFSGDVQDAQERTVLDFVFEGEGDPRDLNAFDGRGYLELDRVVLPENLAHFLPFLESLPALQGSELSARAWLHSSAQQRITVEGELGLQRALKGAADEFSTQRIPTQLNTQFTGSWSVADGVSLALQDAFINWSEGVSPALNAVVSSTPDSGVWQLRLPELPLEPWLALALQQPQLPERVRGLLTDLQLRGRLERLRVDIPLSEPMSFRLSSNLNQVSSKARKGIPGIQKLDGYLDTGALAGHVDIASERGFQMFFPDVYRQPIDLERMRGQVAWAVNTGANQVHVNSGLLQGQGEVGEVSGYFFLDAPFIPKSRPSELMLQLGLQDSEVTQHKVLVPYLVPQSLQDWLNSALVAGEVPQASFIMRGYFGLVNPAARTVQLGINAQASELKFDPRWPALSDFSGFLNLDDRIFQGFVDSGSLLGSQVANVGVELQAYNPDGEGSLLSINGGMHGPAADGLSLLVDTPLRSLMGGAFDSWRLEGDMAADIELSIPLSAGQPGHYQDIQVHLNNAQLGMADLNLVLDDVVGGVRYSSLAGLESAGLSATLWQQPVTATISSEPVAQQFRTHIDFQGPVVMPSLAAWLQRPEVSFAEGQANVRGRITVPANAEGRDESLLFALESDLQGVTVNLPTPYGKTAQIPTPFSASIGIKPGKQFYRIDYRDMVSVGMGLGDARASQGLIRLAEQGSEITAVMPADLPASGLLVEGSVPSIDASDWLDVSERYGHYAALYTPALSTTNEEPTSEEPSNIVLALELGALHWGDYRFDQLNVTGQTIPHGWQLMLDHPILAGEVLWYDNKPLQLDLDYLRWPLSLPSEADQAAGKQEASDFVDPLANVDPRHLIPMDFSAREVKLGADDFGAWSFLLRPIEGGVAVSELQADIRGAQLGAKPKSNKGGAEFTWLRSESGDISHFSGMVSSSDLVKVFESWGQPKTLESKRARLAGDLTWLGSPAAASLAGLEGGVTMDIEKGRFFKSTGRASNALLRLFGLFNFDSWARRLRLDFSDLYKGGMAFDSIDGQLSFAQGQVFLVEPIKVDTPSASLQMGGQIDLRQETLETSMVATLPVGGNATLIAALAGGLPVAAGVYAVSKLFKRQVDKVASVSYQMTGAWSDPEVEFHKLFDNKAAKQAAEGVRKASDAARRHDIPSSNTGEATH